MRRGGGSVSSLFCVISDFRRDVQEICDLLGFNAASSGNPIPTFRASLSVEMGMKSCPEMSVRNYHITQREIPGKRGPQIPCSFCQSFKFVSNTLVYY